MSQAEVQRFAAGLKSNEALRHEIDNIARDPMPSVVSIARQRGYDFTVDEAKAFIRAKAHAAGTPIADADLDRAAGGAGDMERAKGSPVADADLDKVAAATGHVERPPGAPHQPIDVVDLDKVAGAAAPMDASAAARRLPDAALDGVAGGAAAAGQGGSDDIRDDMERIRRLLTS